MVVIDIIKRDFTLEDDIPRNLKLVIIRTNEFFRRRVQEDHHKSDTPLQQLPTDMVKQLPFDYMHQVYQGVMKRLRLTSVRGPRQSFMLSGSQITQRSENLVALNNLFRLYLQENHGLQILLIFGKQQSLDNFCCTLDNLLWKEFFHLLQTLHGIEYWHILVNEKPTSQYNEYAQVLLLYFAEKSREI